MITFTLSRLARHAFAVWLGVHYGRHVLVLWRKFSATYGTPILIFIWTVIAISVGIARCGSYGRPVTACNAKAKSLDPAAAS